jgi:8-oxo-dGTP diphosphatase
MDIPQLHEKGTPKICPVIALLRGSAMVVGLRHYTPDKWKSVSVWTIPGGRCDEGEMIETTLRRETEEEIGIREFAITDFLGELPGAKEGDVVYLFAGETREEPQLIEPEKFSEWRWMPLDQIPDNFINPLALERIKIYAQSH